MSDDGSEPDDVPTVDDVDISSLETAVDSLLDKTQAYLGYPYQEVEDLTVYPSTTLDYRFGAEIEVSLDTSWTLFTGFTLTNISLRTQVSKAKGIPGELFVSLSATADIGDVTCTVTGTIPRLSTQGPIDFILLIEVEDELDTIPSDTLISSVTNGTYDFSNFTQKLDPVVQEEIEGVDEDGDNQGVSYVASAFIMVEKPVTGSFFLKQLALALDSDVNWTLIPERLNLSDVSISASLSHDAAGAPWNAFLGIDAGLVVNKFPLLVRGQVEMADNVWAIDLSVGARPMSNITPETVLETVLGSEPSTGFDKSKYDSALQLPPSAEYPTNGEVPFSANLAVRKDGSESPWYISAAGVTLDWDEMFWYPFPGVDLSIDALYFSGTLQRDATKETETGKLYTAPFAYQAAFGGSLTLANYPLSVLVTYDSPSLTTTLICTIDDSANVSLQDLASDALINPSDPSKAHNLNLAAQDAPVPDSLPLDLSLCNDSVWRTDTSCMVQFDDTTLSRVQLKANFEVNWQITEALQVTNLGIFFDITNPISDDLASVVQGYAYGSVLIGSSTTVFAFIAGVKDSKMAEFAVGLTASYSPGSSLGVTSPQNVFNDPKFSVSGLSADTWKNWSLPSSFPETANVADTVASVYASMLLRVSQVAKKDVPGTYDTNISSLQASLQVTGNWPIFDTIALTDLYLRVNVYPASAANKNQITYDVGLAGRVSSEASTASSTYYTVILVASIVKALSQPLTFMVKVIASTATQDGDVVSLGTFLQMPVSGLNGTSVLDDPSAQAIPSELAAKPASLLSGTVATCSLTVANKNNAWILQSLDASLTQADAWVIIPDKLVISESSVRLNVLNPRDPATRSIKFSASTKVTVGNLINIVAAISVSLSNGKEDELVVTLTVSNLQDAQNALTTLAGTSIDVPPGTPDSGSYGATLALTCKKGESGFTLTKIVVAAVSTLEWGLSHFTINGLAIAAVFDNINTSMTTLVGFTASGSINNVAVNLAIIYSTQLATMTVKITSSIQPTQVVGAFVGGGLSPSSPLDPPDLTSGTGLSGYATTPTASGEVVFKKTGMNWNADSLSFGIQSGTDEWSLVDDFIVAKDIRLALVLTGLSASNMTLSVVLALNFEFEKRPPPTDAKVLLPCSAVATKEELVITVDTSQCSMPQFLYTVTGGYWNPPDSVGLPSIGPDGLLAQLVLTINWDEGYASFKAVLKDWNLSDKFPKLMGMKEPRFEASITRKSGNFNAVGQLAGTAIALAVEVPLSFDLPDGPFRVFGIDVKEAYDVAKKLYDVYRTIMDMAEAAEEVAAFMAEVAEFLGALEIAADVAAGLAAAGVAAGIIGSAISSFFGGSSSQPPKPNQDDPSSNKDGSNGQPALVLGGSLLSPGPAGENVNLFVYPKDKFGAELKPFDLSQIVLGVVTPTNDRENVAATWNSILSGCSTTLHRPASGMKMWVEYHGSPAIEADFENVVQPAASVFSLVNSDINFPSTIGCLTQGLVVVVPKDQYGQPRYGPDAAPALTVLSFTKDGGGSQPVYDANKGFSARNDSLLLPFSLPTPGTYSMSIAEASNPTGDPRVVHLTAINAIDPKQCITYGEGLCTGVGGKAVQLSIKLKDQSGNAYIPISIQSVDIQVIFQVQVLMQDLTLSLSNDTISASYTRPASGAYSISIMINGVLLGSNAISLNVTTVTTVGPSIAASKSSITSAETIAVGDQIEGIIYTYDTLGNRWYLPLSGDDPTFKIVCSHGIPVTTDNGDGSYTFTLLASSVGTVQIQVLSKDESTQTIGSPMSVNVKAARLLTSVVAYGSGLNRGHDQTGVINIRGLDQYGADCAVKVGVNVSVTAVYQNQSLAKIAALSTDTSFCYTMPAKGDDSVLVIIRPMAQAAFHERIYRVTCNDPSPLDLSKSFIEWDSIVIDGSASSQASLYTVNAAGERIFTGGAFVQIASVISTPLILAHPIVDNLDGSYSLPFTLPPSITSAPWPRLAVNVNRQSLLSSPYQFPLQPLPMVSAIASGPGLSKTQTGVNQTFTMQCLDAAGQLTGVDYQGATAYVLEGWSEVPKYTVCTISSVSNGTVTFNYTLPDDAEPGKYHVHIIVNSEPIASSPIEIDVTSSNIDDINEAWQVQQYTLASSPERWIMSTNTQWTIDNSKPNTTVLTSGDGSLENEGVQSYQLGLNITDDWLMNGFMFSFDITMKTPVTVEVAPITQPQGGELVMIWNPKANSSPATGTSAWNYRDAINHQATVLNTGHSDRMSINYPSPTTLAFFYLLSPDKSQYTITAFQAGQYITRYQWAHGGPVPNVGFTIKRVSDGVSIIEMSNITTLPGYFRNIPAGQSAPTATASDFQEGNPPSNVLDGNPVTFWHSEYSPTLIGFPHTLTIDLRTVYAVSSVMYTPRGDGGWNGRIGEHTIDSSIDGKSWGSLVQNSTWSDDDANHTNFFNPTNARYIRLTATSEAGNRGVWSSVGELVVGYVSNATESPNEIDWHAPWAAKYITIANAAGTLDNRGLIFNGQEGTNLAKWPWIYQQATNEFGMSVSVWAVSIPASYDYSNSRTRELTAVVRFGGFYLAPGQRAWLDWGEDYSNKIADADVLVGPEAGPNIIYVVTGKECATVFANGKFQFSTDVRMGHPIVDVAPPELYSWWTDLVWHKLRTVPGLKTH